MKKLYIKTLRLMQQNKQIEYKEYENAKSADLIKSKKQELQL